jgi:hypothetical protein
MTDSSGSAKKTVNITDGQNMIFDHVSIQWGRWDNFGITGTSSTVTLQNSIVGEGVPPQNFGSIIDGEQDITIAHNLWIDNNERNPKFKANGECINNVVYDWGTGGGIIGGHSANSMDGQWSRRISRVPRPRRSRRQRTASLLCRSRC